MEEMNSCIELANNQYIVGKTIIINERSDGITLRYDLFFSNLY